MLRLPSWIICVLALAAGQIAGATEPPREIALHALEEQRTQDDRKLTDLEVPKEGSLGETPHGTEIYLVKGYINYQCTRLFLRDGKAMAQKVKMARSWFYSPKESYTSEEWEIPGDDFARAWEAMRLIELSSIVRKHPLKQLLNNGWSVRKSWNMGSHEPTFYVRAWSGTQIWWNKAMRGMSSTDGVQDFEKVQTKAQAAVIENLLPKEKPGKAFAISEWGPFLTELLTESELRLRNSPARLDKETEVVIETSLRLLGQMGYSAARKTITAVAEDARETSPKSVWEKSVLQETEYALQKIALQERFQEAEVAEMIRRHGRRINSDRDMVQWLRDRYFEKEPEGYLSLLERDITAKDTSEGVLLESIAEMQRRYPDKVGPLLKGLLINNSTEVSVNAALAVLKGAPDNTEALQALTRAAGNPHATIPAEVHSFSYFGRERALDYLTSKNHPVPPKYQWDTERIDQQLSLPWEDGRMIKRLISTRDCLDQGKLPDSQKIEAYRKALAKPYTMGTVEACSELINLKDKTSAKQIAEVLSELRAGCNKGMRWEEDPEAKYGWIGRYDLEEIEEELKKISPSR